MNPLWVLLPIALYLAALIGTLFIARYLRRTRWPFKEEDRLLRAPGESLQKEVRRLDESFLFEFLGGVAGAVVVIPASLAAVRIFRLPSDQTWVVAAGLLGGLTVMSIVRILILWKRRQAYHLGWFGERIVAEKLAPLRFAGWRTFHDVPFVNNGRTFNIDHVVVGEGGLFVIETKARRKGGGPRGSSGDEVEFDGHALHWPRKKNDVKGLDQAERNAATLSKWLEGEIGQVITATPILVIPGWSLKFTGKPGQRPCRVESANWIQKTFKDCPPRLTKQTADLIALRLLAKCRDVQD